MFYLVPIWAAHLAKTILLVCVCFMFWATTAVMGQDVALRSIDDWIAGLGADSYLSRLKSEEAIFELGSEAIDPIKRAVNSPDIEISIRAQRLTVTLLERDFDRRKESFLEASLESLDDFGFVQWPTFAKLVGRTKKAKQLFMDIVQNQRDKKSSSAQNSTGDVGYLGYLSTEQEQYTTLPTSAVEIAEELFNRLKDLNSDHPKSDAEPLPRDVRGAAANQRVVIQQLSLSAFEANLPKTLVKTVNESTYREEIRGLIIGWIRARKYKKGLTRNQIEIIFQFELTQLTEDLNREIKDERSRVRLQAAEAIAKTGGPDAIKMLLPFVRGSEIVLTFPEPVSGKSLKVTLGDIAFQLILALEDQPQKDFGLLPTAGTMLLSKSPVYGFVDRESATDAIAKWEINPKR